MTNYLEILGYIENWESRGI